jgi:hypothetical protein
MNLFKKNFKKYSSILFIFIFIFPLISFAQDIDFDPADKSGRITNPLGNINNINDLIKTLLEGLIRIGMPIIALAIIYSGFLFVFARGNSEKLTKAKDALLYTLIGAAILLGSWGIAQLISDTVLSL